MLKQLSRDVHVVRRRTVVDGARVVSGRPAGRAFGRTSGQRACRQRGAEKNHLIEVAPFGRLDQMLRTTV